jgi:hypothetical protein
MTEGPERARAQPRSVEVARKKAGTRQAQLERAACYSVQLAAWTSLQEASGEFDRFEHYPSA